MPVTRLRREPNRGALAASTDEETCYAGTPHSATASNGPRRPWRRPGSWPRVRHRQPNRCPDGDLAGNHLPGEGELRSEDAVVDRRLVGVEVNGEGKTVWRRLPAGPAVRGLDTEEGVLLRLPRPDADRRRPGRGGTKERTEEHRGPRPIRVLANLVQPDAITVHGHEKRVRLDDDPPHLEGVHREALGIVLH